MSDITKSSEVVEKDFFQNTIESADKLTISLKNSNDELLKSIENYSKLAKLTKNNTEGVRELVEIERKQKSQLTEKEKVDRQIVKLEERKNTVTKEQKLALAKLRLEKQKDNKLAKDAAVLSNRESSERSKLTVKIRRLSDMYREMVLSKQGETKESKRLLKQILALKKARDKAEESLGNHQHKVARYENALGKLRNTLGQLGLAFGVFEILRNSFETLSEYDEKLADIQKTTGLAADQTKLLSVELFNIDTRSSITELQELTSAAGRLGIEGTENILGFVRSADKLFVALGDDLGGTAEEIATNIGKIAENFGLIEEYGIEEAVERVGSVMNELSANSKAGAGAIFDFTQRLAGVAAVSGIAQTDIQALGALFDSTGQSMEVAASTLSQLLPALSKDQERFAEVAGLTADEFSRLLSESPIEALKAVAVGAKSSESGLDGLVETLGDFGVESVRAAGIVGVLAENTEELTRLQDLANEAFEANISISEEFDTKNETLNASVSKLTKKWDELVIKWSEGKGIGESLKNVINFLTQNLETIVKVVFTAIKAFTSYKLATKLWRIEVNKSNKEVAVGLIPNLIKSGKALLSSAKGFKFASFSVKSFSTAVKTIPFAGIVSGLVTLVSLFWDFSDSTDAANESTEDLVKSQTSLERVAQKTSEELIKEEAKLTNVFDALKNTTYGTKERTEALEELSKIHGVTLENLKDEAEFTRQLDEAYTSLINNIERKIRARLVEEEITTLLEKRIAIQKNGNNDLEIEENLLKKINKLRNEQGAMTGDPLLDAQLNSERIQKLAELEQKLADIRDLGNVGESGIEIINAEIEKLRNSIGDEDLFSFEGVVNGSGNDDDNDIEKSKIEELNKFKKQKAVELKDYENDLLQQKDRDGNFLSREYIDERLAERRIQLARETGKKIEELDLDNKAILIEHENKYLKDVERNQVERVKNHRDANEEIEEDIKEVRAHIIDSDKKEQESFNKTIEDSRKVLSEYYQFKLNLVDKEIQKKQEVIEASRQEQQDLKSIARERGLDVSESIAFEKAQEEKAIEEQKKLEREKARREALIAGLNFIGKGGTLAEFKENATGLKSLVKGMFYKGTKTTLGDELGYTGRKDSHLIMADENEAILNPLNTKKAGIGINRTTDQAADLLYRFDNGMLDLMNKPMHEGVVLMQKNDNSAISFLNAKFDKLINEVSRSGKKGESGYFDTLTGTVNYQKIKRENRRVKVKI